jgi:NitT/TauT family transport system permease protein
MMMSMSGGWFFVVASEAITVGNNTVLLPGVGSYLAKAIDERNLHAVGYVIITMVVVIVAYDQLLFRPLVAFADKFRMENTASATAPTSWLLNLIERTRLISYMLAPIGRAFLAMTRWPLRFPRPISRVVDSPVARRPAFDFLFNTALTLSVLYLAWALFSFARASVSLADVVHVAWLGAITLVRVLVLIVVASLVWVPLGVLIGLRPRIAEKVQPLAQFLAAFPANLLFPVFVVLIVRFHGNPDLWLSPLIILGTQWYLLFNVVAGASAYPNDFKEAAANFHIRGWQWWRQAMLPGIFPYYITGAITASGGAWNASIVSESVSWGDTHLAAHGLGAYIAQTTAAGDYPHILLGIGTMSIYVVLFNRLLWRPLYAYAAERTRGD